MADLKSSGETGNLTGLENIINSKSEMKDFKDLLKSKKGNLTVAKIKSLISSAIAQQRKKISDNQTPRTGVEKSQWVSNKEKGYGRGPKNHPILMNAITGNTDGLTPVATAKQNNATIENSLNDPKNTPSNSAKKQAQAVLATTHTKTFNPHG